MTQLLHKLSAWFSGGTYGQDLDAFVSSKRPQSNQEVEYWIRCFDTKYYKGHTL